MFIICCEYVWGMTVLLAMQYYTKKVGGMEHDIAYIGFCFLSLSLSFSLSLFLSLSLPFSLSRSLSLSRLLICNQATFSSPAFSGFSAGTNCMIELQ